MTQIIHTSTYAHAKRQTTTYLFFFLGVRAANKTWRTTDQFKHLQKKKKIRTFNVHTLWSLSLYVL